MNSNNHYIINSKLKPLTINKLKKKALYVSMLVKRVVRPADHPLERKSPLAAAIAVYDQFGN